MLRADKMIERAHAARSAIDYDPFARGYVTSLARPSGNVTGVFFQQIDLAAKRIQLVKDAFPFTRRRAYSFSSFL